MTFTKNDTKENAYLKHEHHMHEKYVPDFSNVHIGQTWTGKGRLASFIRDLGLRPMPAGKNTRKAQERSIARSCEWIDDADKQMLTLLNIFPERLEKTITRPHKYEPLLETILLYRLQERDTPFTTTYTRFFKDIGALPKEYLEYPAYEYYTEELLQDKVSLKELNICLELFRDIARKRLGQILKPTLEYITTKGIIKESQYTVIVVNTADGKKHVSPDATEDILHLTQTQVEIMLDEATEAILSTMWAYDKTANRHIRLNSINDLLRYNKWSEFKELHDNYVREYYDWQYTYKELSLSIPDGNRFQPITYEQYKTACYELNKLLVSALESTIQKKNSNLLEKYENESEQISELLEKNPTLNALYETGTIDDSSLLPKRQYIYPDRFMLCVEAFLSKEISIPPC